MNSRVYASDPISGSKLTCITKYINIIWLRQIEKTAGYGYIRLRLVQNLEITKSSKNCVTQ